MLFDSRPTRAEFFLYRHFIIIPQYAFGLFRLFRSSLFETKVAITRVQYRPYPRPSPEPDDYVFRRYLLRRFA